MASNCNMPSTSSSIPVEMGLGSFLSEVIPSFLGQAEELMTAAALENAMLRPEEPQEEGAVGGQRTRDGNGRQGPWGRHGGHGHHTRGHQRGNGRQEDWLSTMLQNCQPMMQQFMGGGGGCGMKQTSSRPSCPSTSSAGERGILRGGKGCLFIKDDPDHEFVLFLDARGFEATDIFVKLQDRELTVCASHEDRPEPLMAVEKRRNTEEEEKGGDRMESTVRRSWTRSITLPEGLSLNGSGTEEGLTSTFIPSSGCIRINGPRRVKEPQGPKSIPIQVVSEEKNME